MWIHDFLYRNWKYADKRWGRNLQRCLHPAMYLTFIEHGFFHMLTWSSYILSFGNTIFMKCSSLGSPHTLMRSAYGKSWIWCGTENIMIKVSCNVSGRSRISHRGGVDLIRGAVDPWGTYISKILHVKTKESGPIGGCTPGMPP